MTDLPSTGRRRLLAMLATLPVLARAGRSLAAPARTTTTENAPVASTPFPDGVALLVAGPADGALNRWADALQPAIEQSLQPDATVRRLNIGGADGVTGANQFAARGAPDGLTAMLVPGQSVLAWLVGDPRVQFDASCWLPVMAGVTAGIVAGRPAALSRDRGLRIGAAGPAGPDLPALLGCDLLGARIEPVFGLTEPGATLNAFVQNAVDAVFLRGHNVPDQLAGMAAAGGQPLFALDACDEAGNPVRDPAFPDVPILSELAAAGSASKPDGPLYHAWCASAAASRLEFGLVLPQLTPAAMVALWRRAGAEAAAVPGMQTMAASLGVRPLAGVAVPAGIADTAADTAALLELRRWLAKRFNWRPT